MLKKKTLRTIGLAAAAGLTFSLAACGGSSQTTAEACEILESDREALDENMDAAMADLDTGDVSGLVGAFDSALDEMDATVKKINNDEVKVAAVEFNTAL